MTTVAEDAERHERLRNEVIRELVETEVAYVDHLKTIVQVPFFFAPTFLPSFSAKQLLTPKIYFKYMRLSNRSSWTPSRSSRVRSSTRPKCRIYSPTSL